MPRTPTLPPTEPAMWKKLLAKVHPDAGGDHELFIWTRTVQERVCGTQEEAPTPPRSSNGDSRESARVPFNWNRTFDELTFRAVDMAQQTTPRYGKLLELLED
jgi:hypothetical protein